MDDKIIGFITNVDSSSYKEYEENIDITSSIDLSTELNEYDYSWVNQIEQYLPFITKICNTEVNNMDKNVLTSYENRFIRTLVIRLNDFIDAEQKKYNKLLTANNSKNFKTNIFSVVNDETIEVEIKVKTTKKIDLERGESYGLSLIDRIKRVSELSSNLLSSPLVISLSGVSLVHSPINMTPVLSEELNYRKAVELYNFLDNFKLVDSKLELIDSKEKLNSKLMVSSFLEYQLLKDCLKSETLENSYKAFLERIIEKMVLESSMDEKSFKKLLSKKFEDEYAKKKNREKKIQDIFIKNIDNYNKQVKDALRALKS